MEKQTEWCIVAGKQNLTHDEQLAVALLLDARCPVCGRECKTTKQGFPRHKRLQETGDGGK